MSVSRRRVALADWVPDQPALTQGASMTVKNVYPIRNGYKPLGALAAISTNALDARCVGAVTATTKAGSAINFAGTADKLYKLSGTTLSDISQSGGYALSDIERWEFAQYGQRLIAVCINENPQYYDMNTSTLFADLAGSPNKSRHIGVIRDFVVLGNDTVSPSNLTWSGFNNSEQWTPGTNQSDVQELHGEGGPIHAIHGGEVGYIMQERAITRMTYVGTPLVFQFDTVETLRGPIGPNASVKIGSLVYYRGRDSFYVFDGNQSVSISSERVDRWFNDNFLSSSQNLMTVGTDPVNKLVVWGFVSVDATDNQTPDTLIIYNWDASVNKWSYAKVNHELIYPGLTQAYSMESLALSYPDLDTLPTSLDSSVWQGGAYIFSGYDTSHKYSTFTGANLEAVVDTEEFEGLDFQRSFISNLRPICDASTVTAVVKSRERLPNSQVSSVSGSMNTSGEIPVLASGRTHAVELTIPSGSAWTAITAVDVEVSPDGTQ